MKKAVYLAFVLMIIFTINNRKSLIVNADTNVQVSTLNEETTKITNPYGITGEIMQVEQTSKSIIILTDKGLYYIKDGKTIKYSTGTVSDSTTFQRSNQDVTISPILQKDSKGKTIYIAVKINLDSGKKQTVTNYNYYLKGIKYDEVINTFIDAKHYRWFSIKYREYPNNYFKDWYVLYRIGSDGKAKKVTAFQSTSETNYEKYFFEMSNDGNNNLYYTVTTANLEILQSKLYRVDNNLKITTFSVNGKITDYKVASKGDMWIIQGSKTLLHLDKNGKVLLKLSLELGKSINIDAYGAVYIIDGKSLKQVSNNKLYTKTSLGTGYQYTDLSMASKSKYIVNNENTFNIVNGSSQKVIVLDSYVKFNPWMIKDNMGNVTIVSRNYNTQEDKSTKFYRINADGTAKFKSFNFDIVTYVRATGYNGEIYLPVYNQNAECILYKITADFEYKKYATIKLKQQGEIIYKIEADKNGNIYFITDLRIYKVSTDKTVKYTKLYDFGEQYQMQLEGFIKDKYQNLYIKYRDTNYRWPVYSLLKVNDINNMVPVMQDFDNSKFVDSAFLSDDNELLMLVGGYGTKRLYRIDEAGKAIEDKTYDESSYYNLENYESYLDLDRIITTSDGTIFYDDKYRIFKKSPEETIFTDISNLFVKDVTNHSINQVVTDNFGRIYFATYENGIQVYDTKVPKILKTSPTEGQSLVATNSKITITFDEPIMMGKEFTSTSLTLNGVKVRVSCMIQGNKLIITPITDLKPDTVYTVSLTRNAIKDLGNNSLADDFKFTFHTK